MGKVVLKCPACNYYYDGGRFPKCPYCKTESGDVVATIKETPEEYSGVGQESDKEETETPRKKSGFWGRFVKKVPAESDTKQSSDVMPKTVPVARPDTGLHENVHGGSIDSEVDFSNMETSFMKTQPLKFSDYQNDSERLDLNEANDQNGVNHSNAEDTRNDFSEMLTVGRFIPPKESSYADPKEEKNGIEFQEIGKESLSAESNAETPAREDDKKEPSLMSSIRNMNLTQGRFLSSAFNAQVEPVVGWLVCVKGQEIGKSFQLKKGRNKIGRSVEMDVKLLNENSVSRTCQGVLIYDSRAREYFLLPGESDTLCYLNGKALYERTALSDRDTIEFGDSYKNKYMFVAFCNQDFDWSMTEEQE